jgi:hypothetical protein
MPVPRPVASRFLILISALPMLMHCSGDPEPSIEEKVARMLYGTWLPALSESAISLDGNDVQDEFFQGFTITFEKEKFTTTGTSPVWLREDTWWFKPGTDGTHIIRGMDEEEIVIERISDNELILKLNWSEITTNGRMNSFPGVYTFTLIPK